MTRRAVIIEDDHIQSIALKLLLGKLGFEPAATCTTGESAIQAILEHKPDLIVSDIYLGDRIDGIEVVRSTRARHMAPVIFISGQSRFEIEPRISDLPNCTLIGKPVTLEELRRAIEKAGSVKRG